MSDTVTYRVAAAVQAVTDAPAYKALLEENDELCRELERVKHQNHELAQVMLHLNDDRTRLFRAVEFAIGEMTAKRGRDAIQALERVLKEVGR